MTKWHKINFIFFTTAIIAIASLVYVLQTLDFSSPFGKPWHLQPSVHEDSLSQKYLNEYMILNDKSLFKQMHDSSKREIFILVDAWGVPNQESKLQEEFAHFERIPHTFALHQRLGNRTKHAERVEFRNEIKNKMYLFGGDSSEYSRHTYLKEMGYKQALFCQHCNDEIMLTKLDSLQTNDSLRFIAWTTQSSRTGDNDSLHRSLKQIADFAAQHPDVLFVIQGTHRPILGSADTRKKYKSHWVPAIILNGKK